MPPPLTPEQFFQLQMQMMATLNNTVQTLQQIHAQPPPPPPQQTRDRRADFLRGHPPTFSHTADPLQADDWLRSMERQLDVAQCDDRERVLYAAGQLRGSALDWWESYPARDRHALTWVQFQECFRNHHIPAGVMKMKHKEFLALKQVNWSKIFPQFLLSSSPPLFIFVKLEMLSNFHSLLPVLIISGSYDGDRVP
jgi:hypothetical protein